MRTLALIFSVLACLTLAGDSAKSDELTTTVAKAPPADDVQWVAIAVSRTGGRVFQSKPNGYENGARAAAIAECERATGVSCANAISVPAEWDMTVISCGGRYFVVGSGQGIADQNALDKAAAAGYSRGSCQKVASY